MDEHGGEGERNNLINLNRPLWHACAGRLVHLPPLNSKVFYFPQGHAEHAEINVDYMAAYRIPPNILCRVDAVDYNVDSNTDEVFGNISLVPVPKEDQDNDAINVDWVDGVLGRNANLDRPIFLSKVLTQSDANNGGGFSVPKKLAESIFPALNYHDDPPVQNLRARDIQGKIWTFRHIYRGRPLRHLLTTGWSKFVTAKNLVAGDSVVFSRGENGEVFVGIRRVMKESVRRFRAGRVFEAAALVAQGKPFQVSYYPNNVVATEFCVQASAVFAAVHAMRRSELGPGRRFKMAIESIDSSGVDWYEGSVNSFHHDPDPSRWPGSLWRLLEVTWDGDVTFEKRTNPWLVQVENHEANENNHEDNSSKEVDNSSREADNSSREADNSSREADNSSKEVDNSSREADNSSKEVDHSSREADNSSSNNNSGNNRLHLFGKDIDIGQENCAFSVAQVKTARHQNEDISDDSICSPQKSESNNQLVKLFGQPIHKWR